MADRLFSFALILAAGYVWWATSDFPFATRCLPAGVMILVGGLAVFNLIKPETPGRFNRLPRIAVFARVTLITIIIMQTVGFFAAATAFICVALPVQGVFRIRTIAIMTGASLVVVYFAFIQFFRVPLPTVF